MKKEDILLYQKIDDILWHDWDPIGLNDNIEIRDEYSGYIPHILKLKLQNADVYKISQHLFRLVTIDMGMGDDKELILSDCKRIAQKIVDI